MVLVLVAGVGDVPSAQSWKWAHHDCSIMKHRFGLAQGGRRTFNIMFSFNTINRVRPKSLL